MNIYTNKRIYKRTNEVLKELVKLRSKRQQTPVIGLSVLHDAVLTELEREKRMHIRLGKANAKI